MGFGAHAERKKWFLTWRQVGNHDPIEKITPPPRFVNTALQQILIGRKLKHL
jgi:hypothetical protein